MVGAPYRDGVARAPMAPAEDGLVDELIRQFTDPLAFYRELVQNSIDAGSSRIVARVDFDERDAELVISVRDDGCGMSREVLEGELTVLFRSSKEKRDDAIGKFGVGFVSVLAIEPTLVEVRTCEGSGLVHTLQLSADQTYELFEARSGEPAGTTVTLRTRCEGEADKDALFERSLEALSRWCRFARVPIVLSGSVGGEARQHRIDRPLGFEDAVVQVVAQRGPTEIAAALRPGGGRSLAFFNRGLLLREDTRDVLGDVHVAIVDPRLGHTLSRDDVRQDAAYESALAAAASVVRRDLVRAARQAFSRVGEAGARPIDVLLEAAISAGLPVADLAPRFPLGAAVADERSLTLESLKRTRVYVSLESSPEDLELAARSSVPVLDLRVAEDPARYLAQLERLRERPLHDIRGALVMARVEPESDSDLVLIERTEELLRALIRRPRIRLMRLSGGGARLFVTGRSDGRAPCALEPDEIHRDPFARWRRPPLWLAVAHPMVAAARERAVVEPDFAAAMLARAILLSSGRLDEAVDERWLDLSMKQLRE